MRRTGKVPKFLSHRLFPSASYLIWLDSKMRLHIDPMLIVEYFLWRKNSEYVISNHYDRHCVWVEVFQNKRLNKYNHTAIDGKFAFYRSDGLTKLTLQTQTISLLVYYARGEAWHLPDGAFETISLLKDNRVKVVVVSNFDTRLRKLLKDLRVLNLFDAMVISSEVGYEKPDAKIFKAALEQVSVEAEKAVHVGDDEKADKEGANAVGISCL